MGQGFFENPSFGPQAGVDFEVPLLPHVGPMDDGPATSLDIVDQYVEATEVIDDPADETFYRFGFDQVRPEDQVR